ncbi:MAG: DUF3806 domain-containing protein [Proteobacteria bacterium]|nr:DUF3806 domain-containing protein [Pseudomonadota bacterium]
MNRLLAITLSLLLALTPSAMCAASETTIQTPEGPVTTAKKTVAATPQKIELVGARKRLAFDASARQAREFVQAYLPGISNPSLGDFDKAFGLWQEEKDRRYTERQVIDLLGAYLGNRLAADFQMEWVTVTDRDGADFAVRAKKAEVMAFPFSSVAKRIQANQHDFMVGVYFTVQHTLASGDYRAR